MKSAIKVRFQKAGKLYYFDALEFPIRSGDHVIVETVRGIEYGECIGDVFELEEEELKHPLKPVLRVATPDDDLKAVENKLKETQAFRLAKEKIRQHNLEMKLLQVEYTFDAKKLVFYFSAEGRVDFRDLVRDLAAAFHTRIELRQIGVRDEAKIISGLGTCGRELCCASWMGDFQPVSIKMAKDQNLSLNPTKISGICGRLMCCLNYEDEAYRHMRKGLPKIGAKLTFEGKPAEVKDLNILRDKVLLRVVEPDDSFEMTWVQGGILRGEEPKEEVPQKKEEEDIYELEGRVLTMEENTPKKKRRPHRPNRKRREKSE